MTISGPRQNRISGQAPAKGELRREARQRRAGIAAALSPEQYQKGARALADAVMSLVGELMVGRDTGRPLRVAAYESLPVEPPTGPLIEALHAAGHHVIVPVTLADWSLQWRLAEPGVVGDASTVARLSSVDSARPQPSQPSRPSEQTGSPAQDAADPDEQPGADPQWLGLDALSQVDLVLAPGLSVDSHGTRLGQGGGCYDRALVHCNPAAEVFTVLHEGELSAQALTRDEHDRPVDGVITTTGQVLRVRQNPLAPA